MVTVELPLIIEPPQAVELSTVAAGIPFIKTVESPETIELTPCPV